MTIRFATPEEVAVWDDLIVALPSSGNVLQSREFAEQKIIGGWTPRYVLIGKRAVTILEKRVPILGKLWYCPKGPGVTSAEDLELLLRELRPFAKKNGVFCLKIEPEVLRSTPLVTSAIIATKSIQPESTVLVNLRPSEDDIIMKFNQKGRHAIRRAERDGVTVSQLEITADSCQIMYGLLEETSKGAGYPIRPKNYYDEFYQRFSDANIGQLFIAYVDNLPVAGAYSLSFGSKSLYIYGASTRDRNVYGASHLLQWRVMQWAKSRGSIEHDLGGTPPSEHINDPSHPLYGVGRFKTSFDKVVTDYVGTYDVPIKQLKALFWHKFIEKLMRRQYFRRHHQSMY